MTIICISYHIHSLTEYNIHKWLQCTLKIHPLLCGMECTHVVGMYIEYILATAQHYLSNVILSSEVYLTLSKKTQHSNKLKKLMYYVHMLFSTW